MERKLLISIIITAVIVAVIVFGSAAASGLISLPTIWPRTPSNLPTEQELPDKILIDKANELEEVKAFRDRYGETNGGVERIDGLDVYYYKTKAQITGQSYDNPQPLVSLRIRFDSDLNVDSMLFWCLNQIDPPLKLEENILEYLEKEYCFS